MNTQLDLSFRHILTVSELTCLIKSIVEESFPNVWVEGEIYNFRAPISGHAYFTLKDSLSQIKAVLFKSSARTIRFVPKDGLHVLCRGRITIYDFRGEYQLVIDYMEPKGVGALLLAFEQLKERLSKEGLFDESRKRPVPVLPKKIGIVTSPTGAAIRDILKVIERRFANVEIVIAPAAVQGERAAPEIVEAISALNRIEDIDVIIVTRGGGGIEYLWPFNEESVARAIYNSKIPVISAVGHEIDYTIADFVADLRAPTPSAAAEMVVKNKEDIQHRIETLYQRLVFAKRTFFEKKRDRLFSLSRRVLSPGREINRYIQRVDELATRLHLSASHIIALKKETLYGVTAKLDSLSPLAILSRGYSITYKLPARSVVKSSSEVQKGDKVDVKLHEGNMICIVEGVSSK